MSKATKECLSSLAILIQEAVKTETKRWDMGNTKQAMDYLTKKIKREEANKLLRLESVRKSMFDSPELQALYEKKRQDELFHRIHVRKCMSVLNYKEKGSKHDCTKDEFYFLITIFAFDKEVNWSSLVPDELLKEVINQHYHQEAHHPEYEEVPGQTIKDADIMEMAVDRLSRNLQFNGGQYNKQQWRTFEPDFLSDHKTKLRKYKEYRDCVAPIVEETWKNLKNE